MTHIPVTAESKPTSAKVLDAKAKAKSALQKELGWPTEARRPLICLPAGLSEVLGSKLFEQVLPGLLSLQVEILILGKGSKECGEFAMGLAKEENHRIAVIPNEPEAIERMLKASDMALFLFDSTGAEEVQMCLEHGTVPIALGTKDLENYNPVQECGQSFIYDKADVWQCFAAIVRALETYVFPFDWKTIQKHCLES